MCTRGRRTSARHPADVSGPIDRAVGAMQRGICCAGMCGRTIGRMSGDEHDHGDIGHCQEKMITEGWMVQALS